MHITYTFYAPYRAYVFLGGLGAKRDFQSLFLRALFFRSRPCFFCPGRAYGSDSLLDAVLTDSYMFTQTTTAVTATAPSTTHPIGFHMFAVPNIAVAAMYPPPAMASAQ